MEVTLNMHREKSQIIHCNATPSHQVCRFKPQRKDVLNNLSIEKQLYKAR
jgi:hypothetical protein